MGFPQSITPKTGTHIPLPCIWHALKSQDVNLRTATFTDWDWFWYITSMGLPGSIDHDVYCQTAIHGKYRDCDTSLVVNASAYLDQVCFSNVKINIVLFITQ